MGLIKAPALPCRDAPPAGSASGREAGPHLRVTEVSLGFVAMEFAAPITDASMRKAVNERAAALAMPPEAAAHAIAFD